MTPEQKKEYTEKLMPNAVVQLDPGKCPAPFGGQFLIVEEVMDGGVQGYCVVLNADKEKGAVGGVAYYRTSWENLEVCGKATWEVGGLLGDGEDITVRS